MHVQNTTRHNTNGFRLYCEKHPLTPNLVFVIRSSKWYMTTFSASFNYHTSRRARVSLSYKVESSLQHGTVADPCEEGVDGFNPLCAHDSWIHLGWVIPGQLQFFLLRQLTSQVTCVTARDWTVNRIVKHLWTHQIHIRPTSAYSWSLESRMKSAGQSKTTNHPQICLPLAAFYNHTWS